MKDGEGGGIMKGGSRGRVGELHRERRQDGERRDV